MRRPAGPQTETSGRSPRPGLSGPSRCPNNRIYKTRTNKKIIIEELKENVLKYLLLALIAVSQLFACRGSDDEKTPADNFDVQFTVPGSVDVTEGGECTFAVSGGGKSPLTTDTFILESDAGISYVCPIVNTTSDVSPYAWPTGV